MATLIHSRPERTSLIRNRLCVAFRIWLAGTDAHVQVRGSDTWHRVAIRPSIIGTDCVVLEGGTLVVADDITSIASKSAATGYGP